MSPAEKPKSRKADPRVQEIRPAPPDPATVPVEPPEALEHGPEEAEAALVPIEQIYADAGDNHRRAEPDDQERIEGLMRSFAAGGQQQPILVHRFAGGASRDGHQYELAFGYRRLQAARRLGWPTIRAEVRGAATPEVLEEERAIENLHRQDVGPAGEMVLVEKMLGHYEGDAGKAAARLGKPLKWVTDRTYLIARLDPRVLALVQGGHLPLSQAREIAKLGSKDDQVAVVRQVLSDWQLCSGGGKEHNAPAPNYKGETSVMSVEKTRELVAAASRSLKVVQWVLDKPFARGPACVGCPDNTRSDPVLFEGSDDPDAAAGLCLNQVCFLRKWGACEQAKEKVLAEVRKREKRVDAGAVPAGSMVRDAIARSAPEFIKPATVERYVKKQLDQATGGAKSNSRSGGGDAPPTDDERRNQALHTYVRALFEWQRRAGDAIHEGVTTHPGQWLGLLAAEQILAWDRLAYCIDTYGTHGAKPVVAPPDPPSLSAAVCGDIVHIAAGTPEAHLALARSAIATPGEGDRGLHSLAPELYIRLAAALGIKLRPAPAFESFLPEDLRLGKSQADTKDTKPATKKKLGKGKKAGKPLPDDDAELSGEEKSEADLDRMEEASSVPFEEGPGLVDGSEGAADDE